MNTNHNVKFHRGDRVQILPEDAPYMFGIIFDIEYLINGRTIYTVIPIHDKYNPFERTTLLKYLESELDEAKPIPDKFSFDCLSKRQYKELCREYITRFCEDPSGPCDSDLEAADEVVAEDVVYRYYENSLFSDDDFECSALNNKFKDIELIKNYNPTNNERFKDGDTILADIMEQADFRETGISDELFKIWENTYEKKSIEALFYLLTGERFECYLEICLDSMASDAKKNNKEEKL